MLGYERLADWAGTANLEERVDGEDEIDPEHPVREDVTVFTSVRLELEIQDVGEDEAQRLVEQFKRR